MTKFCIQVWAIRHKPSGQFMPALFGKRGGWSSWTPPAPGEIWSQTEPRIFYSRRSAAGSLAQWLRGEHVVEWHTDRGSYYEAPESWTTVEAKPVPSRKREDMELVEMSLEELPW